MASAGGGVSARGGRDGMAGLRVGAGCAAAGASVFLVLAAGLSRHGAALPPLGLYAALVAFASGLEAAVAPPADRSSPPGSTPVLLAQLTGLLLLANQLGGPWLARAAPAPWRVEFGSVALLAGAMLRAAAIRRLGGRFNSDNHIAAGAALETGGLYRRLAHPSELGLLLVATGAAAFWGGATAWLVAPLYLVTLARLSLEEAALTRRHGASYARYRRATFDPFPNLTSRGGARA